MAEQGSSSFADTALRWSYTSGTSDTPLLGLTIGDLFDRTAATYPDHPALISRHQQIRLTYRELQAQVDQCAHALLQLDITKGQRVGIWSPNRAEWCITQFATSKIGAILVNINPAYRLNELEYVLNQSGCSALVIAAAFKSSNYTEMITTLAPELGEGAVNELHTEKLPHLRTVIRMGEDNVTGMLRWADLMALGVHGDANDLARIQREQEFDDPINIQLSAFLVRWAS